MFTNRPVSRMFSTLMVIAILLALALGAPGATSAQAAGLILFVTPTGAGDCATWAAACGLQTALTTAVSGDEIWVAAGTYKPTTSSTDRTATFTLKDGVALYGGFAGTETTRDQRDFAAHVTTLSGDLNGNDNSNITYNEPTRADNSYRVVTGASGATLDGFTVTAGNASVGPNNAYGGGMYNKNSNPALTNVIFSNNSARAWGGAMINFSGNPTLMNVTFNHNSAAQNGGGLANDGGTPTLTNATFSGNSAVENGGGLYTRGTLTLTNATFSNNSANLGGGMYILRSAPSLTNITFSGNSASRGGGIYNEDSSPVLTNATFNNNSASQGGGMGNYYSSNPQIRNTVFWGNTGTYGAQIYNENGDSSPTLSDSVAQGGCPVGATCVNLITADPLLGALANYGGLTQTVPLLAGSSAIDSGSDAACALTDQRGADRPVGAHCDIGAYEYGGTPRPDTQIDTHPVIATIDTEASFTFTSLFGSATFECSLDGAAFEACSSPKAYTGLAFDPHTFAVRAKNPVGDLDATPASFAWTIYAPHTAGVRYAAPTVSGAGDCSSWGSACALQTALLTSISGDEIWVAAGTHKPTAAADRSATFQLKNGVALYGGFAGTETAREQRDFTANLTILSGDLNGNDNSKVKYTESTRSDNSYHVVAGATGATLDGFTITAGNANNYFRDDSGGGMYNLDGNLTLANITFSKNTAIGQGAGLYNYAGNPTLTNVTFNGNSAATNGGGMYNVGSPTLTNVTFSGNSSDWEGGGMQNYGTPTLVNVTFSGNSATTNGGGMLNHVVSPTGDVTLTNVTFSGNSASYGGGIYNTSAYATNNVTLTNVTFSGNSASYGGGVFNQIMDSTSPQIRNTIFWGNTAILGGAQIFTDYDPVTVSNSVVQGGCPAGNICTNIIKGNPLLGALGDYGGFTQTIPLLPGSSAINTGNLAYCTIGHDQRGVSYVGVCDIGAYESDSTVSPTATPTITPTPTLTPTPTVTRTPVVATQTFNSIGAQDGWVLESSETSNVGGVMNSSAATFNLGDDAAKRQYRGILSFNTGSLPDNAIIAVVTLRVKKQAIVGGGDPPAIFQGFMADIKNGFFGTAVALQAGDFQANTSKSCVPFTTVFSGSWYSIDLTCARLYINKLATNSGLTQIRLRFKLDDNNNAVANILGIYSGNAPAASQPQLVITYYVP